MPCQCDKTDRLFSIEKSHHLFFIHTCAILTLSVIPASTSERLQQQRSTIRSRIAKSENDLAFWLVYTSKLNTSTAPTNQRMSEPFHIAADAVQRRTPLALQTALAVPFMLTLDMR